MVGGDEQRGVVGQPGNQPLQQSADAADGVGPPLGRDAVQCAAVSTAEV